MREPVLADHFQDLAQQRHAARLGMWIFVGSETLLFGGLFAVYGALRAAYPKGFADAAHHSSLWLGTLNTLVLLTSSFLVACAVLATRRAQPRRAAWLLLSTAALGLTFLGVKAVEYTGHFREGIYPSRYYRFADLPEDGPRMFFTLYYFMTGLHALHVAVGVGVVLWLANRAWRDRLEAPEDMKLELGGMYWHLVDIVWLFLWPLFYLVA